MQIVQPMLVFREKRCSRSSRLDWRGGAVAFATLCLLASESAAEDKVRTFDVPASYGTYAQSIGIDGTVTGYYWDASGVVHGFVRAAGGRITTFAEPGSINTYAFQINRKGSVAGDYLDHTHVTHGFVRNAQGNMTSFDPPQSIDTEPY